MTQKDILAEHRINAAKHWLQRQPFNPSHNSKTEAIQRFIKQVMEWAQRNDPHEVAPTFHAYVTRF